MSERTPFYERVWLYQTKATAYGSAESACLNALHAKLQRFYKYTCNSPSACMCQMVTVVGSLCLSVTLHLTYGISVFSENGPLQS